MPCRTVRVWASTSRTASCWIACTMTPGQCTRVCSEVHVCRTTDLCWAIASKWSTAANHTFGCTTKKYAISKYPINQRSVIFLVYFKFKFSRQRYKTTMQTRSEKKVDSELLKSVLWPTKMNLATIVQHISILFHLREYLNLKWTRRIVGRGFSYAHVDLLLHCRCSIALWIWPKAFERSACLLAQTHSSAFTPRTDQRLDIQFLKFDHILKMTIHVFSGSSRKWPHTHTATSSCHCTRRWAPKHAHSLWDKQKCELLCATSTTKPRVSMGICCMHT